jgi:hypothetical protein
MPPAGKDILTVFWDFQGVLLTHFQKHGEIVKLRDAICRKRPGQLVRGVLLLHDSARPHTARENSQTTVGTS